MIHELMYHVFLCDECNWHFGKYRVIEASLVQIEMPEYGRGYQGLVCEHLYDESVLKAFLATEE